MRSGFLTRLKWIACTLLATTIGTASGATRDMAGLKFENSPLQIVLRAYGIISSLEVIQSPEVARSEARISLPPDGNLDKAAAVQLMETTLLNQAGVVITRGSGGTASASLKQAPLSLPGPARARPGFNLPEPEAAGAPEELRFGGIGAIIGTDDETKQFIIRDSLPGSPTARANVPKKAVLRSVDGVPTEGLFLRDIIERIRGPAGSTVRLEVLNPADSQPLTFSLEREEIRTPPSERFVRRVENPITKAPEQPSTLSLFTNDVLRVDLPKGARVLMQYMTAANDDAGLWKGQLRWEAQGGRSTDVYVRNERSSRARWRT
ncbi:MAG TPA: hypothetical protein VL793_10215 [Patescibacteria group bacterium]|nr:hypothetical protein [Patescibacteria group bacterium]